MFENDGVTVKAQSLKLGLSTVVSGVRPWNGRARGVILRGRHVRSTFQRSVRPAIHVPSRGSLRSSSTGEPSDPPFGAMYSEFTISFPMGLRLGLAVREARDSLVDYDHHPNAPTLRPPPECSDSPRILLVVDCAECAFARGRTFLRFLKQPSTGKVSDRRRTFTERK